MLSDLMLTIDLPYSSPGESEDLLLGGGRDHRSGPRNLSSAGSQGNVPACGAQGEGVCHGVGGGNAHEARAPPCFSSCFSSRDSALCPPDPELLGATLPCEV